MRRFFSTIGTIFLILILMVGISAGAIWTNKNYILVGFHFYPRSATYLDLRDRSVSKKQHDSIVRQLPDCQVTWTVPLSSGGVPDDAREITVTTLTQKDLELLNDLPQLTTIHAEECRDYAALRSLYGKYQIFYNVAIGNHLYDQDTEIIRSVALTAEDIENLGYLPKFRKLDASGSTDYELLAAAQIGHPEWEICYTYQVGYTMVKSTDRRVELEDLSLKSARELLDKMPSLKNLKLINPKATGKELVALREEFPNATIHWTVDIHGKLYSDTIKELDISDKPITGTQEAEKYASYFPNLEKLIVDSGKVDNEKMAALREAHRDDYKVVWTVYFSPKSKLRTDEKSFIPIKQGEYYFQEENTENLKYCEELEAIDIGHSAVKTIDFVKYMPHIKYLILAHTQVKDITPISCLKELIFLEIDWSLVTDYTPLQGCTALEDLNIGRTWGDVEPLYKMTWLKNLWCVERGAYIALQLQNALPKTHVNYGGNATVANGWRKLPNYFKMRDALGMYYMEW